MSSGHEIALGFAWLSSVLAPDSALRTSAPGGIWRGIAPPNTNAPFVVMAFQSGSDVVTMNGFRMIVDASYQVKAVGPAAQTGQLATAAERIDMLLGGPPGTPAAGAVVINSATVGQVLACYRTAPIFLDEPPVNGEIWSNVGGLYRVIIEQTS